MFTLPKQLRVNTSWGSKKKLTAFKAEMQNKQRIAWINTIKKGYDTEKSSFNFNDGQNHNVRLCIRHFHPSTISIDENGKPSLKVGACPTLLLHEFGSTNKTHEETRSLSRFVQSADDTLKLQDLENKCMSQPKKYQPTNDRVDTSFDASVDTSFDASVDTSDDVTLGNAYQIEDSSSSISYKPKTDYEASIIKAGIKQNRSNKRQAIKDIDDASKKMAIEKDDMM